MRDDIRYCFSRLTRHLHSVLDNYCYRQGRALKDSEFTLLENYGEWLMDGLVWFAVRKSEQEDRPFVSEHFKYVRQIFYMIFNLNKIGVQEYYDLSQKFYDTYISLGKMLKQWKWDEQEYYNIPIVLRPIDKIDLKFII